MYPAYMSATAHPSGISILVMSAEFFGGFFAAGNGLLLCGSMESS